MKHLGPIKETWTKNLISFFKYFNSIKYYILNEVFFLHQVIKLTTENKTLNEKLRVAVQESSDYKLRASKVLQVSSQENYLNSKTNFSFK